MVKKEKLNLDQLKLQQEIIEFLIANRKVMVTDLIKSLPQIKGEMAIYMPVKEGINPNIFWMIGVSEDFTIVFNNLLIIKKLIQWAPEHLFTFLYLQAPVYKAKQLTNSRQLKGEAELWLPISITLKPEKQTPEKKIKKKEIRMTPKKAKRIKLK